MTSRLTSGVVTTIPGPPMWELPRIGLYGLRRPHELAWELRNRFGSIARLGRGRSAYVYLFGEEATRLVMLDSPGSFTWGEALRPLEPVVGPSALVLSDGEEHRRRRRLVQPAFATRRIDAAVPILVEEVDRIIDHLPLGIPIDLYQRYRTAVRRIVVRVLFGDASDGLADEIGAVLEPAIRFSDRPSEFQTPAAPSWWKARRGRRRADRLVDAEIARRRTNQSGSDVLGVLLGSGLTDGEIRDQVVSLIAAGYETSAAAIAWTLLELLRHPSEMSACRAEVADLLGPTQPPSASHLRSMPRLAATINESLRLWPPATVLGRHVREGFDYAGYRIPAGITVLLSPYVTQRSAASWGDDAQTFRPSRWDASEPPSERFLPFGGPYRRCIGFALALTEIQVALIRLLQRTSLTAPAIPDLRGHGLNALKPDSGVPVVIAQRT